MADSLSTGQGIRGRSQNYSFGGSGNSPRSNFDDNVPAGVDPEGAWRFGNSDRFRRHGTTAAERAGAVPGYTPGYGRSAAGNTSGGLTPRAQWDSNFQQRLTPAAQADHVGWLWPASSGGATSPENPGLGEPRPQQPATNPLLPPAATPAMPALPVLPPSPGLGAPVIQQTDGSQSSVRAVTGLPSGQTASASFVPGQNNPQNLAKRTRPPVDPLAV